ncbi:MAG TPA: hypothetical protein VHA33_03020 [Candidatus Angelobacter sp.]|jgi:hypothetical protein|nr:hypothetical protein [Candidatus Angelobacter sp.]
MRYWMLFLLIFLSSALASSLQIKPASAEVSFGGTLESQLTLASKKLRFAVSLTNGSDSTVNSLKIANVSADYVVDEICTPQCHPVSENPELLAEKIAPGSKFSAWGLLKPLQAHRKQKVTIVLSWTQNGQLNSSILSLGENEVQGAAYYYMSYLYGPIKTFAIPATLALLGYLLNRRAKKREEAKADADKEQGIRAEIWKQMLPTSHELASKYYMPISREIEHTARNLSKYAIAMYGDVEKVVLAKEAADRAFFYALSLEKRMIHTRQKIGGFIFKDLRGEELAISGWLEYKRLQVGDPDSPNDILFRSSASRLKYDETFESFCKRFSAPITSPNPFKPEIEVSWRIFRRWLEEKRAVLASIFYLRVFGAIIDYELNRPYQYWYQPGPKLQLSNPEHSQLKALAEWDRIEVSSVEGALQKLAQSSNMVDMDEYLAQALNNKKNDQATRGILVIMKNLTKLSLLKKLLSPNPFRKASVHDK